MSLRDDVANLKNNTLTSLNDVHDYYFDTKHAWAFVIDGVGKGEKFTVRNVYTGIEKSETDLVAKARGYMAKELSQSTFLEFISIFEAFFFDLLREWLLHHPESLGKKQIDVKTVLDAPNKDAVILAVVNKELYEVSYGRVADWFKYIEQRMSITTVSEEDIGRLSEAKASRDVIIHNRRIVNAVYREKSGKFSRHSVGEILEIPEDYHREVWELMRRMVDKLADCATGNRGKTYPVS